MNKEKKQKAYSYLGATEGYFVDKKILSAFEEYEKGNKEAGDAYMREVDRLEKREDNSGGRQDFSEEIERLERAAKESASDVFEFDPQEFDSDEIPLGSVVELVKKTQYDYDLDSFLGCLPEVEGMSDSEAENFVKSQGILVDDQGVWIPAGTKMKYLGDSNGWPTFAINDITLDFAGDAILLRYLKDDSAVEEVIKDEKESTDKMPKEACAMEND